MPQRRWFNNRLPQTLAIAQFLLYFDAVFLALDVIGGKTLVGGSGTLFVLVSALLGGLAVCAYTYGGWGIANELKRGYQVAVVASFIPIIRRLIIAALAGSVPKNLMFILLGSNSLGPSVLIGAMFQYALIGLLLHPMSKEHQKIWFT